MKPFAASDYGGVSQQRTVDQIVVNHGTVPLDDLYFEMKPMSRNLGAVDHPELIAGRRQSLATNPDGTFQLIRIGDAVSARNTHAAIYDALRFGEGSVTIVEHAWRQLRPSDAIQERR